MKNFRCYCIFGVIKFSCTRHLMHSTKYLIICKVEVKRNPILHWFQFKVSNYFKNSNSFKNLKLLKIILSFFACKSFLVCQVKYFLGKIVIWVSLEMFCWFSFFFSVPIFFLLYLNILFIVSPI